MEETAESKTLRKTNKISNILIVYFIIMLFLSLLFKYVIGIVTVSGYSMSPTYYDGELLIINTFTDKNSLKANDVITFYSSVPGISEIYIKRIVGVPGDSVLISDGFLYINGEEVNSEFDVMQFSGIAKDEMTLKENEYFVLGDNRNESKDSRVIGPIETKQIIGKVIYKIN